MRICTQRSHTASAAELPQRYCGLTFVIFVYYVILCIVQSLLTVPVLCALDVRLI